MKEETVAVVGLGYVGLPLATSLAGSGQSVFGIDVDVMKLNAIENSSEDLFGIESPMNRLSDRKKTNDFYCKQLILEQL